MNARIRDLKLRLKYKENELTSAKRKVMQKEQDYNVVKFDPRLEWYGKTECRKAKNDVEWLKKEIAHLKQELERAEKREEEGESVR